jgi:hypothetical protein
LQMPHLAAPTLRDEAWAIRTGHVFCPLCPCRICLQA